MCLRQLAVERIEILKDESTVVIFLISKECFVIVGCIQEIWYSS